MKTEGNQNQLDVLSTLYSGYLHPSNKFKNKDSLIFLIKHLSVSLCYRVRFERTKLSEDPNFRFKYLFLSQEDIKRFIESLKPLIEGALQDEKCLDHLSQALKNFITLDIDSILSMFLFQNFKELDELTNSKFIPILNETIAGTLVSTDSESKYKYEFIQTSIEYLLEQAKSLEPSILKATIHIFNAIWSVLPVLSQDWCKKFIERTSKNGDYDNYMRVMKKKRAQEYQYYKLYEKISSYAQEYFEVLKRIMNLGIPIKDEVTRGFWFLLNAMQKEAYEPLIQDLIDTANQDHSKKVIGGVLSNVAARDTEMSTKIAKHALSKLIVKENGSHELNYHNYEITEFYLIILMSVVYQNKETVTSNKTEIFALLKLLASDSDKDIKRQNTINFAKSILRPFVEFIIHYDCLLSESRLKNDEFMKTLWKNNATFDLESINFNMTTVSNDDISNVLAICNEDFIPWLNTVDDHSENKNMLKVLAGILKETHLNISMLLPSRNTSKENDFTTYFYESSKIDKSILNNLQKAEGDMVSIAEKFKTKISSDDSLKTDVELIKNIGHLYKQVATSNSLGIKGVVFNANTQIFSMLEYKTHKRLETSFIAEIGGIIKMISGLGKAEFDDSDATMKQAIDRLYEFEELYSLIPSVQKDVKTMAKPEFIEYYDENEKSHINKFSSLHMNILKLLQEISEASEIEVVTRNQLAGSLIMFDKMANSEVLKKKDQIIRIILLVYTGSNIKDEKITKQIWNVCVRSIASAQRWKNYNPRFTLENDDSYHTSNTFATINK